METKRVLSFDVGIKNLAFCVVESGNTILVWRSISLAKEELTPDVPAMCMQCKKKAVWKCKELFFCKKHGTHTDYYMPVPALYKKTKAELQLICKKKGDQGKDTIQGKDEMLKEIRDAMLIPIVKKKSVHAQDISLIDIAKTMTRLLDSECFTGITDVLIENQISPIAGRMKTLQGILTEYFVIRYPSAQIRYISSANKLKSNDTKEPANKEPTDKSTYADHKKDAIELCRSKIEGDWLSMFESYKKKDDLADCYLQACWFMSK